MRILLAAVLTTVGCAHYYKLDVKSVTDLELASTKGDRVCARGALIDVSATTKDGKKHEEGTRDHIDENEFDPALVKLTASIGDFNDRSWNPPKDPLALLDKTVKVTATLVANPQITQTIKLDPTWRCDPPVAYVGGGDGGGGETPYSQGIWGEQGTDGTNGGHGGDGYSSVVSIGYITRKNGEKLALVRVTTDGLGESLYVLDPKTPMKVLANGGAGGAGGDGGPGGAQEPSTFKHGGNGGRGGDGGDGGDGGSIAIRYDAASPELLNLVLVNTGAGDGGAAGGGGWGGNAADDAHAGAPGTNGRPGRPGRAGPEATTQAVPGLSAQLAASVGRSGGDGDSSEPVAEVERPTRHDRKHPHDSKRPPALDAPPKLPPRQPGHEQRPQVHSDRDGARQYVGLGEVTISVPKHAPVKRKGQADVESTRTRKHHFTLKFSEGCQIDLHRPPGEKRHHYVLDAPVGCPNAGYMFDISTAILDLDTENDTMKLSWDGKISMGKGNPPIGTMHYAYDGKRR